MHSIIPSPFSKGLSLLLPDAEQLQVRLHDGNGMFIQELLQVFVKMAIIIIAVGAEVEIIRRSGQIFNGFPYPHNLEGLFAVDTRCCFKITL